MNAASRCPDSKEGRKLTSLEVTLRNQLSRSWEVLMVSATSDFQPCKRRQWQLRQLNSSQKLQDPKFTTSSLKKNKLQWQVPHTWWEPPSTVTMGVGNEPATGNRRVTAHWPVQPEHAKGIAQPSGVRRGALQPSVLSVGAGFVSWDAFLLTWWITQGEHVYAAGSALIEDGCSGRLTITCLACESLQVVLYTGYKALGKCLCCGQQWFC